jgi:hypothetical protein
MNIFEEISWPQFVKLERISKLQLNEQVKEYNQYIYDLSLARQNWLNDQPKGPISGSNILPPIESDFLLQENSFYLLQENGDKIIITST